MYLNKIDTILESACRAFDMSPVIVLCLPMPYVIVKKMYAAVVVLITENHTYLTLIMSDEQYVNATNSKHQSMAWDIYFHFTSRYGGIFQPQQDSSLNNIDFFFLK